MQSSQRIGLTMIVVAITILTTLEVSAPAARAETDPAANAYLWAAQACYLEATWKESDCVALLYVTRKRARRVSRPWVDVLRDYSAISGNTPRAQKIRAFPWGDIPDKSEKFNERWRKLRELVVEVTEGKHKNPCPHAEHWGGTMDHARGRMVPARCAVSTANTFYVVKR